MVERGAPGVEQGFPGQISRFGKEFRVGQFLEGVVGVGIIAVVEVVIADPILGQRLIEIAGEQVGQADDIGHALQGVAFQAGFGAGQGEGELDLRAERIGGEVGAVFQIGVRIEGVGPIALLLVGAGDGELNLRPKPGVGKDLQELLKSGAGHGAGLPVGRLFAQEKQALLAKAADGEPGENVAGRGAGGFFVAEFGVGLHQLVEGDVKQLVAHARHRGVVVDERVVMQNRRRVIGQAEAGVAQF